MMQLGHCRHRRQTEPLPPRPIFPIYRPILSQPPQGPMENVVLIIHLLLALGLIAIVLLQRSEGGGLGMGGGGGGAISGRPRQPRSAS